MKGRINMAFKVCRFSGAPDFETLQAAKLTDFPLEKRDYKPFSQARICFSAEGFHVQFHCFEAESLPQSAIHAFLRLPVNALVELTLYADGRYEILLDGESLPEGVLQPFTGEDLQGVYWGGTFTVPMEALERRLGYTPGAGDSFTGNFYKVCRAREKPHYGSFFPADFEKPLDAPENMGTFLVVNY